MNPQPKPAGVSDSSSVVTVKATSASLVANAFVSADYPSDNADGIPVGAHNEDDSCGRKAWRNSSGRVCNRGMFDTCLEISDDTCLDSSDDI